MQQDFINGQFCPVFGGFGFDFGKMRKGCNVHIVRLPQDQQLSIFQPRGVDFRNSLNFSQTNNVYVAPPALPPAFPLLHRTFCHFPPGMLGTQIAILIPYI